MRLKHVELISTRGRQTLMVLVMMGGEIHQRILTLTEVVGQEQLSQAAEHISILCQGMNVEQIKAVTGQMSVFEQDMMEYVVLQMNEAGAVFAGEVYLDGLTNVLAEPEFSGSEESRRALRLLQEPSMLEDLLSRTVATSSVGGVQVLIGGEGSWDDLRQCSIVLARYGSPGLATGTLGVLGPMRMSYGRTISAIRFLSGLLSEMVTDSLID
jgi:heat-inducible transcriptional repressor